jgi:hypothetical protein
MGPEVVDDVVNLIIKRQLLVLLFIALNNINQ